MEKYAAMFTLLLVWGCGDTAQDFYLVKDPTEVFYVKESAENFNVVENVLGTFSVEADEDYGQKFSVTKTPDKELEHYTQSEEVVTVDSVDTETKVNILWSVDNSNSMADHQRELAENFSQFIQDFVAKDIDFKMAIVTTDSAVNKDSDGKLNATELKKNKQQFIDDFKSKIKVGTMGSVLEYSFKYAKKFFEQNPSWIESDSLLVVIFLSDEREQSKGTVKSYEDYLSSLVSNDAERLKVFSICRENYTFGTKVFDGGCTRYKELSTSTDGLVRDITKDSFTDISKEFGKNIVNTLVTLKSVFPLSISPGNFDQLKIQVNGSTVPKDEKEKEGWNYDTDTNAIEFFGSYLPPSGSRISIREEGQTSSSFRLKKALTTQELNSLEVSVNGIVVPRDTGESDGWNYDENNTTIDFFGSHLPAEGEKVSILLPGKVSQEICLGQTINPDKLSVSVNGKSVSGDSTKSNGWAYDRKKRCVGFFGSHALSKNATVKMSLGVNSRFCLKKGFDLNDLDKVSVVIGDSEMKRDETETDGWNYNPVNHCVELFGKHKFSSNTPVKISLGLTSRFCLNKPLDESRLETVEIRVDDKLIERGGTGEGWDYDREDNCVEFFGTDSIRENAQIKVTYRINYRGGN